MPQYTNRYTPALQYNPQDNSEFNKRLAEISDRSQQRYDVGQEMLGKYQEQLGNAQFASPDRPFVEKQLSKDIQDINDIVKNKYAGDYGNVGAIQRELASRRSYYTPALQRYQEEQKYAPMLTKLEAEKKLIMPNDARKQSVYNAETGKFNSMPDYKFYERPDYGDVVYGDIGKAIDSMVSEGKIKQSDRASLLETITTKGLSAISGTELGKRIEKYIPEFEAKTPFGVDPEMQAQYKGNTKQYLEDVLKSRVSSGTSRQYINNKEWELAQEDARKKAAAKGTGEQFDLPFVTTYKMNTQGSVENVQNNFKSLRQAPGNAATASKNLDAQIKDLETQKEQNIKKFGIAFDDKGIPHYPDGRRADGLMASMQSIDELKNAKQGISKTHGEYLKDLKDKYSIIYKQSTDDQDFLNKVEGIETNRAKTKEALVQHADPEANKYFTTAINEAIVDKKEYPTSKLDVNYNPVTGFTGNPKKFKMADLGEVHKAQLDLMNGKIIATNKNGDNFEVNPNAINEVTEEWLNTSKEVLNKAYNYNDEAFKPTKTNIPEKFKDGTGKEWNSYKVFQKNPTTGDIEELRVDSKGYYFTDANSGKQVVFKSYTPETFGKEVSNAIYNTNNPYIKKN